MKSLELLEARQEIARLREELRVVQNSDARQRYYIKTQMRPLVTMGIVQGGKIKTLERKVKKLTIDPEAVVEKMKSSPVWSDYCFDGDDFQAGREITLAVLRAAGVKV